MKNKVLIFFILAGFTLFLLDIPKKYYLIQDQNLLTEQGRNKYETAQTNTINDFSQKIESFFNYTSGLPTNGIGYTKELSAAERIDKFYTFKKKNEEFQQLLNREYEKIKAGNVIGQEISEAEEAAEKRFESRPVDTSMEAFLEREGIVKPYQPKAFESDVLQRMEAQEAEKEAKREIAYSIVAEYQEVDNQLVDAETGLVIRLKRSFTAKMKQSEEKVKAYYSDLKNELVSYKKINSNVSWHGDRFNFGRDTVAKININGKTLCFYLALDPNDPEFKETVYHQKDVGGQRAYESTPFMVKIKSDAAVKKALRLVGSLAEKLGTEKEANFEAVDYVEEFAYASTKKLFDEGYIKATKEKKVDFDF